MVFFPIFKLQDKGSLWCTSHHKMHSKKPHIKLFNCGEVRVVKDCVCLDADRVDGSEIKLSETCVYKFSFWAERAGSVPDTLLKLSVKQQTLSWRTIIRTAARAFAKWQVSDRLSGTNRVHRSRSFANLSTISPLLHFCIPSLSAVYYLLTETFMGAEIPTTMSHAPVSLKNFPVYPPQTISMDWQCCQMQTICWDSNLTNFLEISSGYCKNYEIKLLS